MFPALLTLVACAQETDNDGWTTSFVRQQDIAMPFIRPGILESGWLATEVPLQLVRDTIGTEAVDACLHGLDPGGGCDVTVGECISFSIYRPEEPGRFEVLLLIWPEGCKQASDQLGVRWKRVLTNPGQLKPWTPPGQTHTPSP